MFKIFFTLSPLDSGMMVHPFAHSFPLFTFRISLTFCFWFLRCNHSGERKEKKKMQFRSDCECKQNNNRSYSLLVRCHYCLWYFCHHIALFRLCLSESAAMPHWCHCTHHGCYGAFEEKAFSYDLHITHLFHLLLLFGFLVCLLSIFAHWFHKFNHMLKWTLLRLSFYVILFSSHFSATHFRIQSSDLAKLLR